MECDGEMRLIAFITDAEPLRRILEHIGQLNHALADLTGPLPAGGGVFD